jgi:hypothetical protein
LILTVPRYGKYQPLTWTGPVGSAEPITQTVAISTFHDASVFRFGFENAEQDFWTDKIWFFNEATVTFQGRK